MKNFIEDGDLLEYNNSGSAISSGGIVVIGNRIAVAVVDIAATTGVGNVKLTGVFNLPKATGQAWTVGQALFYDSSAGKITSVGTANTFAGWCYKAAASDDTEGHVKLGVPAKKAAVVAALAGTLTGTVDGTIADVAALSTAGGNTYSDAAVNVAITSINLQLKELQTTLNAVIAAQKAASQMDNA